MFLSKPLVLSLLAGVTVAAPQKPAIKAREGEEPARAGIADAQDPFSPTLSTSQQCFVRGRSAAANSFNVVINNADEYTDDECGSGFLDNINGQRCAVTGWTCNYASDGSTMNANFETGIGCDGPAIEGAIWKAFGHLGGVTCNDWDNAEPAPFPIPVPP